MRICDGAQLINHISKTDIIDGARDFRLMKRSMVDAILKMREYNRFFKGIYGWVGFTTKWIAYKNVGRVAGQTKWSFFKDPVAGRPSMMEALTGLDANAASRDLHMLRQGRSADIRRGEWGKPIWCSRIRSGNGAPTLLYTRDDHNNVVLLHAVHHDDWLA